MGRLERKGQQALKGPLELLETPVQWALVAQPGRRVTLDLLDPRASLGHWGLADRWVSTAGMETQVSQAPPAPRGRQARQEQSGLPE